MIVSTSGLPPPVPVEKSVEITFIERASKPEPGPPNAELTLPSSGPAKSAAAPAAAPVVLPRQKVRKLDKPPPVKELAAPRELARTLPEETEVELDKGVGVYGDAANSDPAGLEGGMQAGVAGGAVGVIEMPPDAVAPRPLASNRPPSYPESARRRGKMGRVKLRIVIRADGQVGDITVVEGEEPFVSAAKDAVRRWRFEPARIHGQAISVYREIPITFQIED